MFSRSSIQLNGMHVPQTTTQAKLEASKKCNNHGAHCMLAQGAFHKFPGLYLHTGVCVCAGLMHLGAKGTADSAAPSLVLLANV